MRTMRLEIHRPKPDPPIEKRLEYERAPVSKVAALTTGLKFVLIELSELAEKLLLVFRCDARSGIGHVHTEYSNRTSSDLGAHVIH